jgi:hypothetical protein
LPAQGASTPVVTPAQEAWRGDPLIAVHWPIAAPGKLQVWQALSQEDVQHTPSAQKVDWHSVLAMHAVPRAFLATHFLPAVSQ